MKEARHYLTPRSTDRRFVAMSTETTKTPEDPTTAPALDAAAAAARIAQDKHDHDDARVDEMEDESFPASDPPSIP